jgi:hypothetical protein
MPGPRTQLSLVFFVILLASAAMAQRKVARDHFLEPGQDNVGSDSARREQFERQITEQEALLSDYRARIKAKSQELEETWQLWVLTGNEAGQDLAFVMQQAAIGNVQQVTDPAYR